MTGLDTRRNAGKAFINNSGTPIPTSVVSWADTPTPAQVLAPIPTLVFALGPPGRYKDENL